MERFWQSFPPWRYRFSSSPFVPDKDQDQVKWLSETAPEKSKEQALPYNTPHINTFIQQLPLIQSTFHLQPMLWLTWGQRENVGKYG